MKRCLTLIFFLIQFTLSAQTVINNKLTESHKSVKEVGVFIIPPTNFQQKEGFPGFFDPTTRSLISFKDINLTYKGIATGYVKESYADKGMELIETKEYVINDFPAMLVLFKQVLADGKPSFSFQFILDYGNNKTLMINASFPTAEMQEQIKAGILSIYLEGKEE